MNKKAIFVLSFVLSMVILSSGVFAACRVDNYFWSSTQGGNDKYGSGLQCEDGYTQIFNSNPTYEGDTVYLTVVTRGCEGDAYILDLYNNAAGTFEYPVKSFTGTIPSGSTCSYQDRTYVYVPWVAEYSGVSSREEYIYYTRVHGTYFPRLDTLKVLKLPDETCNDGTDNDRDGLTDCADPDCAGQAGPGGATCCQGNGNCPSDTRCSYSGCSGSCVKTGTYTDHYCSNNVCSSQSTPCSTNVEAGKVCSGGSEYTVSATYYCGVTGWCDSANADGCGGTKQYKGCNAGSCSSSDAYDYRVSDASYCTGTTCVFESCTGYTKQDERACSGSICTASAQYSCQNNLECANSESCRSSCSERADCRENGNSYYCKNDRTGCLSEKAHGETCSISNVYPDSELNYVCSDESCFSGYCNRQPTWSSQIPGDTILEDSGDNEHVDADLYITDPDGDSVSYSLGDDGDDTKLTCTLGAGNMITHTPFQNYFGSDTCNLQVKDEYMSDYSSAAETSWSVEIEDVEEPLDIDFGLASVSPSKVVVKNDGSESVTFTAEVVGDSISNVFIDLSSIGGSGSQTMSEGSPGVYTYTTVVNEDADGEARTANELLVTVTDTTRQTDSAIVYLYPYSASGNPPPPPPLVSNVSIAPQPTTVVTNASTNVTIKFKIANSGTTPQSNGFIIHPKPSGTQDWTITMDEARDQLVDHGTYYTISGVYPNSGFSRVRMHVTVPAGTEGLNDTITINTYSNMGQPGASVAEYIISVPSNNSAPVLEPIENLVVNETSIVVITPDAIDPDGDDISYSIDDPRFTFDGSSFVWQTQEGDKGQYRVIVTASDVNGEDSSQEVIITVVTKNARLTTTFSDGTDWKNLVFENPGEQAVSVNVPKRSEVISSSLAAEIQLENMAWNSVDEWDRYTDGGYHTEASFVLGSGTPTELIFKTSTMGTACGQDGTGYCTMDGESFHSASCGASGAEYRVWDWTNNSWCTFYKCDNTYTGRLCTHDMPPYVDGKIRISENCPNLERYVNSSNEVLFWLDGTNPTNAKLGNPNQQPTATLDVGDDGSIEWSHTGEQTNETIGGLSDAMNTYLGTCTAEQNSDCMIPLVFGSDSNGMIDLSDLQIYYSLLNTAPNLGTDIPSSFGFGEDSSADNLIDLEAYFTDDNDDGSLTFQLVYEEDSTKIDAVVDGQYLDFTAPLQDWHGSMNFRVKAIDSEGLETESNLFSVAVNPVQDPPTLAPIRDIIVEEGEDAVISPSASDPDGDTLTYTVEGAGTNFIESNGGWIWTTTYDNAGDYTVLVTVSDGGLNDTQEVRVTVLNINRAPILDPIADVTLNEGETVSITPVVTDPDGNAVEITISEPVGNEGIWETGYEDAGVYTVVVTATDGELIDTEEVVVTVLDVNRPPVIENVSGFLDGILASEGELVRIPVIASDPDEDELTTTFSGAMSTDEWQTTYEDSGEYTITVTVSDGELSDIENVTVTINNVNRAPILQPILDITANETELVQITPIAYDPDNENNVTNDDNVLNYVISEPIGNDGIWETTYEDAGIYTVTVTVSDGEYTDNNNVSVTVLNRNRAPVLKPLNNIIVNESGTVSITPTATDPDGDIVTYTISEPVGNEGIWETGYEDAGVYTATVTATDGELTDSKEVTITILNVNRAPTLEPIEDITIDELETVTISPIAIDPDGDIVTYTISEPIGNDGIWETSYDDAGTYTITVTATDGELSDSKEVSVTINNVNRAPVLADIGDITVTEGELVTLAPTASDADGDELTTTFSGAMSTDTWQTTYEDAGIYAATVTVTDGRLSVSQDVVITVLGVNRAPVLETLSDITTDEGGIVTITPVASDPDGDVVEITISEPIGNDGVWETTHDDSGTYTITVTASDGELSDSQEVLITINNVNRAPILAPLTNITVKETETVILSTSATDPDGNSVEITISEPVGNNGIWETSYDDEGTYTVTVTASDGELSDSQDASITVENTNRAPVLEEIADITVKETETITITPAAVDPDGDSITYTTSELVSDGTWQTTYDDEGTYTVIVTASDGELTDIEEVEIRVENINRPPALEHVETIVVSETDTVTITPVVSDPDGDEVAYTISEPVGEDGIWETTYDDSGVYTVTVTASDGSETVSQGVSVTVNNVNRAPVVERGVGFLEDIIVKEGEIVSIPVVASDADGDELTTTFSGAMSTDEWQTTYEDSGEYTVTVTVSDGGFDTTQDIVVKVENVNRAPVLEHLENAGVGETETIVITPTAFDPDNENSVTNDDNEISITVESDAPLTEQNGAWFWETTYDDFGTYTTTVTVSDGELTDSQTISLSVGDVNRAPVLEEIADVTVNETETVQVAPTAYDPDGNEVTITISEPVSSGSWETTYDDAGSYIITVIASDGSLSVSQNVVVNVENVNRPPVLEFVEEVTVDEGSTVSIAPIASDPDGDSVTLSISEPVGIAGVWDPGFEDAGVYTITVTVSDGELTTSQDVLVTVNDVNRAPVLEKIPDITIKEGETAKLSVLGLDADGDDLSYDYSTPFDTTGLWKTGFDDAGEYKIRVTAGDGKLSDYKELTISVLNVNRPPVLAHIDSITVNEAETVEIVPVVSDPDNENSVTSDDNELSYTISDYLSTGSWETTYEDAGAYTITVTATDGEFIVSQEIGINVLNVNRAPVLEPLDDITVSETETVTIAPVASDPDGDSLTYTISEPVGEGSWTTTYEDSGTYVVIVTASDGELSDSKSLTLTVLNVNRAPVVGLIETVIVYENESVVFIPPLTDPDGDEITFVLGDPFENNLWVPTFEDAGLYNVSIAASDGGLSSSSWFTLEVLDVNRQPVLQPLDNVSVEVGTVVSLFLNSSDPDNDTLNQSVSPLFKLIGDQWYWTSTKGVYNVTASVDDGREGVAEQVVFISITAKKNVPSSGGGGGGGSWSPPTPKQKKEEPSIETGQEEQQETTESEQEGGTTPEAPSVEEIVETIEPQIEVVPEETVKIIEEKVEELEETAEELEETIEEIIDAGDATKDPVVATAIQDAQAFIEMARQAAAQGNTEAAEEYYEQAQATLDQANQGLRASTGLITLGTAGKGSTLIFILLLVCGIGYWYHKRKK